MFKCPECGYLGFEDEKKCPKCGSEVTSLSSGEETNSIMNPPQGIRGSDSPKKESQTALIEEPSQIDGAVETSAHETSAPAEIGYRQEQSDADKMAEPKVNDNIAEEHFTEIKDESAEQKESIKIEKIVTTEILKNEFDFKSKPKLQQQELPITHKKLEEQKEIKFYPSVMTRAFAFIIDSLLVTGITSIFLVLPLVVGAGNIFSFAEFSGIFLLSFYFLFIILHLLYYTYFLTITGQTPGKSVFNLKVIGRGGLKLDWHEALLRAIGYILSSIPVGIGFFWAFFDKNKECWHDKLTGSRVVSVRG